MNAIEDLTPQTVTASFKWTRDEFVEVNQSQMSELLRPSLSCAVRGLLFFFFLVPLIILFTPPLKFSFLWQLLPPEVVMGLFLFKGKLASRWLCQIGWKTRQLRESDVLYQFTPNGFTIQDSSSNATLRWNALVKISEAQRGFFLYRQTSVFHWVPFHAFENAQDIEKLRTFMVQSEVPFNALKAARPANRPSLTRS